MDREGAASRQTRGAGTQPCTQRGKGAQAGRDGETPARPAPHHHTGHGCPANPALALVITTLSRPRPITEVLGLPADAMACLACVSGVLHPAQNWETSPDPMVCSSALCSCSGPPAGRTQSHLTSSKLEWGEPGR
uniref:Uncharacterized protein n=1 Tax=Myotis myotis TaxID=51298 RepID=A0A7J7V3T6_MYOMY|nr:hypothetical protein mMyoMyo1_008510 [Myotis myotis]